MIDFKKYRNQILSVMNEWEVDIMEATEHELREVYDHVRQLAKAGEQGLGKLCYSDLHAAQVLEPMIRWELHLRETGEELPGIPYDPSRTAAEERERQRRKRARI